MGTKTVELKELEGIFPGDLKRGIARGKRAQCLGCERDLEFRVLGMRPGSGAGGTNPGDTWLGAARGAKEKKGLQEPSPTCRDMLGKKCPSAVAARHLQRDAGTLLPTLSHPGGVCALLQLHSAAPKGSARCLLPASALHPSQRHQGHQHGTESGAGLSSAAAGALGGRQTNRAVRRSCGSGRWEGTLG